MRVPITDLFHLRRRVLLLFYWGMARSFSGGGFAPPGRMEEGAYGDEVQVDPVVSVLFRPRRVLGVLCACFITFLRIVVLAVWQAALFSILHRAKEPEEERRGGTWRDETEIENGLENNAGQKAANNKHHPR